MKLIRFDYVSYVRKANTYYNAMRAPVDKLDNSSNNLMKTKILMNVAVCVYTLARSVEVERQVGTIERRCKVQ